ncbi:MAG: hypothetical protein GY804_15005 [Alphaproteobacteria bacterium]|nr:hypothetical protein [Alphaproteobacteria bacterium]
MLGEAKKQLDEQGWIDSRLLAGVLGRRHQDIKRSVRSLKFSKEFMEKNFVRGRYKTRGVLIDSYKLSLPAVTLLILQSKCFNQERRELKEDFTKYLFDMPV